MKRQFNVIDMLSGWKADLIFRRLRPFSVSDFERRELAEVLGVHMWVASAEDIIVSKLEWASRTASERQLRDGAGVLATGRPTLDMACLERWVSALGLEKEWNAIRLDVSF
jgi:hypothetical protein